MPTILNSSPRVAVATGTTPRSSTVLSVPSSFNQTFSDTLARFENIVPPWSAGRSQRPLTAKSGSHKSPPSSPHKPSSNLDIEFANLRSAAAGPLGIPMWKFEQEGASALTDIGFRLNHGKVLRSPRSKHSEASAALRDSGFMPLPVQSSNTQGAIVNDVCVGQVLSHLPVLDSGASLTGPVSPGTGINISKFKVRPAPCARSQSITLPIRPPLPMEKVLAFFASEHPQLHPKQKVLQQFHPHCPVCLVVTRMSAALPKSAAALAAALLRPPPEQFTLIYQVSRKNQPSLIHVSTHF